MPLLDFAAGLSFNPSRTISDRPLWPLIVLGRGRWRISPDAPHLSTVNPLSFGPADCQASQAAFGRYGISRASVSSAIMKACSAKASSSALIHAK